MSGLTDEEWDRVHSAVFTGGLRQCIDDILCAKSKEHKPLTISDANRSLLYRAFDAGDGQVLTLEAGVDGYFIGEYDGQFVVEATEISGMLFSICCSSGGRSTVLVGHELIDNTEGVSFHTSSEAKAYIRGLTA